MNVVDSSAWLSYFSGDENSSIFSQPIKKIDELLVPSITLTEVFKCILRQRGEGLAIEAIAHMEQGKMVPSDSSLAIDAAHYGVELNLPLADSIIYATARKYNALVWTQGAEFKSLEGVKYYSKSEKA